MKEPIKSIVRENILKGLYRKEMTGKKLATICGIPYSTISSYICGKVNISLENAVKVADALDITVNDLISGYYD